MATALYYGFDDRIIKTLEAFFKERLESAGETHSISKIINDDKLLEMTSAVVFDMIFVENGVLQGKPAAEWLGSLLKKFPAIKCPVVMVGAETNATRIMALVESGWRDYIVEPPDKALLIEKFGLYASGKRSADIRQVYTMEVHSAVDIAKSGYVSHLSEFDCKIKSKHSAVVNDLTTLYSQAFGEGTTKTPVIGRCYASEVNPAHKDEFINAYYFVGVTTEVLSHIRTNLRKAYVSKKGG